jgi:hypothetical protein
MVKAKGLELFREGGSFVAGNDDFSGVAAAK